MKEFLIWKPWEDFKSDASLDIPEIKAPPCPLCVHWNPQRKFIPTEKGQIFDGVVLCHRSMENDFSCFEPLDISVEQIVSELTVPEPPPPAGADE